MSDKDRERTTREHHGEDAELEQQPELARLARRISELPTPAPGEAQVAQGRARMAEAVRSRNAKRQPVQQSIGSRPLARMAAAVLGVSCLAAATVGGAYATGTRLPENASVGPLSALGSSSADQSEHGQTIILHQENVQTVTNGTSTDGGQANVPLRLHHGVVVSVDDDGVTVEGEDGRTIVVVQAHSRVVVDGKQDHIAGLKAGSVVRIVSGAADADDLSVFVKDMLQRIRAKLSKMGTSIHVDGHGSSIQVEGGEHRSLDIETPSGHIQIETGNVQVEAGGSSVEAAPGTVEIRGRDGTTVKVESGEVTVDGQAVPPTKPKKPKKPATPHIPEPTANEPPVAVPDADELVEDAMRRAEDAKNRAEEAIGDLPKTPSIPRR